MYNEHWEKNLNSYHKNYDEGIQERWLSNLSMWWWIQNISRCFPHIFNRTYRDKIHGSIINRMFWAFNQYFVCNIYGFRWLETKLRYHPQLERRLLRQHDCKVTICRENHWNTKKRTYGCKYVTYFKCILTLTIDMYINLIW